MESVGKRNPPFATARNSLEPLNIYKEIKHNVLRAVAGVNAAGWEKNRLSDWTSTPKPPAASNNNPTLIVSGRVVVGKDGVLPRHALNPEK